VLTKDGTTVGTCTVTPPGSCTAAGCSYAVSLSYDYEHHPLVPAVPLVPLPHRIGFSAAAEGNP
jgi:hypothetical protein